MDKRFFFYIFAVFFSFTDTYVQYRRCIFRPKACMDGPWKSWIFWAPNAISQGLKNSRFPGPNPSCLPKYWMLPASKALHQRCINSYCSSHSPSFIIVERPNRLHTVQVNDVVGRMDLLQMYIYGVRYIQLFLRDRVSEIFDFRFFSWILFPQGPWLIH